MFWNRKSDVAKDLAKLLAEPRNKEEFLGMLTPVMPTPDSIRKDSAAIVAHSHSQEYKTWANEAWGQIIDGLDKILDDRSSNEVVQYHRGAVKAALDLLRISYKAKFVTGQFENEENASLQQDKQG